MEQEVRELLVEELKDAHSAERQALACMKKSARLATSPSLKMGIEEHIQQTTEQIARVEEALGLLKAKAGRKTCMAMKGLVEEATEAAAEHEKGPLLDLVIVAGMQRIEHYEIAAYGTDIALAQALGEDEVASLLKGILAEEKATDVRLTTLTQKELMGTALREGAEEEEAMPMPAPRRRRSA
ncbi:ferritin-like domain-containing protein [Sediminicoccus sp. BL-A-41-H5]|uniref:YciE/YciF ferroxidase family protein n=1 Tax=Sediminicoccus sp. BL-A-41-H5 TaxID=3421106 RepID=UPI003D66B22C